MHRLHRNWNRSWRDPLGAFRRRFFRKIPSDWAAAWSRAMNTSLPKLSAALYSSTILSAPIRDFHLRGGDGAVGVSRDLDEGLAHGLSTFLRLVHGRPERYFISFRP